MHEARRPSATHSNLAILISRDAGIVAPLLKLASSPLIGLRNKITSIFQAISILGIQNALNPVQNIALQQSLSSGSGDFKKLWERSSLTASIAEKMQ